MFEKFIQLGKRVLTEPDVHRVLKAAIDGAIEITGAERGMIILFGDEQEVLFETARNLERTDIEHPKFEISRTIIDRVNHSGEPICLLNALEEPSLKRSASAFRLKILSVICLPLRNKKQTFGVVYLDNRTVEGAFEPETYEFAKSFADFISLAAYHALEKKKLSSRVGELEAELRGKYQFDAIIGHDPKMVRILKVVAQVADTSATVLLEGESGTGKELLARALHFNGSRKEHPFIAINCGALPEGLLESELFGHVKGAFTDAKKDKPGWFESAAGGTLFFDEVSEMTPALQVKLLRVLQTGEFAAVGSREVRYSDVRIIAGTNQELRKLVAQKKFREDLFYRLNVVDISLPPLRARRGDILLLAKQFVKTYADRFGRKVTTISPAAEALLEAYDFPGNVRELENAVQRAVASGEGEAVEPEQLPDSIYASGDHSARKADRFSLIEAKHRAVEQTERRVVINCLQATNGHISNAAQLANFDVSNFHKLIKKFDLDPNDFK